MPIYEYNCSECGHEFEVMQKMSESPKRECEACGKLKAKRIVSQTSFVLKGTGWYTTDYAGKKAHTKSNSSEDGASSSKKESAPSAASKAKSTKGASSCSKSGTEKKAS